jgi:hypothetical protein
MKIAITTCDKNVDAVPWALRTLYKVWDDCPYPVEVVYDTVKPDNAGFDVKLVSVGLQTSWMASMLSYMISFEDNPEPFIWLMDDYMIVYVDRDLIKVSEEVLAREDVGMVRIKPTPGPTLKCGYHKEMGEIDKKASYSISMQATMWDYDVLSNVFIKAANTGITSPWGFELRGSEYLDRWNIEHKFLGTQRSAISYKELYKRGKRVKETEEWLSQFLT